ncbi:MAG: NADH-quinone oxidoreductase subunit NuoG [Rhodobacteraceae bacterium]|nr:NADH-quinone oxidoreductase subunit NuoG [Paracoccaceae bacterium]
MSELRQVEIDGIIVEADPELTLIQACEQAGVEIPRFCYHERLSIAGNCRMCLVEVVGGPPKPTASCAMQVRDLRPGPDNCPPRIRTNSAMVKKAREGVMEFLLINHPLDCPICDQGGECDLQDQAMAYGVDMSRYREPKRAVEELNLGPLVETCMTRCISCTRCVRFTTEVAGITQMGQTGRGEDAEITSYLNQSLRSNLQGNIIDLCPVGALTSKPYAFTARPWELTKTETIDVMDALGSNIRVDSKGREVMRIIPRNHDGVNEEWISDKTRFAWDGLRRQRIDRPYMRRDGRLVPVSWQEALDLAAGALRQGPVAALAGDLVPVEAVFALGQLVDALGGAKECRTDGSALPHDNRSAYVGNAQIADVDRAGRIIILGGNPRNEAPVLNARIRGAWLQGARVGYFGPATDLTYEYDHLGKDSHSFESYVNGNPDWSGTLIIVGQAVLRQADGPALLAAAMRGAGDGIGMLVLHNAAARVGALDVGFSSAGGIQAVLPGAGTVYCLGVDEVDIPQGPFVIYQGSHGDRGAMRADLVLPAAAYTEESGIFVNTEGRPQLASKATFPPGDAKENWAIIRAVSGELGTPLAYDSLQDLRHRMGETHPHLLRLNEVPENEWKPLPLLGCGDTVIAAGQENFYLSNPIARASVLMSQLAAGEADAIAA